MEQLFMNVNADIKLFVCLRCTETISTQGLRLCSVTACYPEYHSLMGFWQTANTRDLWEEWTLLTLRALRVWRVAPPDPELHWGFQPSPVSALLLLNGDRTDCWRKTAACRSIARISILNPLRPGFDQQIWTDIWFNMLNFEKAQLPTIILNHGRVSVPFVVFITRQWYIHG